MSRHISRELGGVFGPKGLADFIFSTKSRLISAYAEDGNILRHVTSKLKSARARSARVRLRGEQAAQPREQGPEQGAQGQEETEAEEVA